jgi:hypothetical protein
VPTDLPDRRAYAGLSIEAFIVPLDGMEFGRQALVVARALAERLGSDVHLLSTVERTWGVADRQEKLLRSARPPPMQRPGPPVWRKPAPRASPVDDEVSAAVAPE